MLTIVALIAHMQVGGNGVDLFGLYVLALIVNTAGLLWACGIAMRTGSDVDRPRIRASHEDGTVADDRAAVDERRVEPASPGYPECHVVKDRHVRSDLGPRPTTTPPV